MWVFVDGKLRVEQGRLLGVDEERLYQDGKREVARLLA
jgi:hypothetical protein